MSEFDPPPNSMLVRVLIVDDSAFVRKVVREMLSRSPFIDVVGMAHDGEEALELADKLRPDVVTCDLTMPRMGGVEYVRRQMAARPVPILMLTASPQDCAEALDALAAGAVDLVQKPTAQATDQLLAMREELVEQVKAAGRTPVARLRTPPPSPKNVAAPSRRAGKVDVVVLGISTGGPQALRYLVPQFPRDFPVPIAIVLHMPVGYTAMFAEKLSEISKLNVREARDGEELLPGTALIAQAGRHLLLKKDLSGALVAQFATQPADKPHRPSVDVLFQSAAESCRARVLGVVMTGMGDDGKQGAAWVKAQGGAILTEAEESCVIYGMPRSVVEAGLSDAAFSLSEMAEGISNHL
ncbi:MAG TPA: chemotaxis-specific protein-glutamate methyltransferase CheB [Verrucomicrobiae bacterium]|jgi:two-component system chemotaxis response regulator CheB|nr:chemotaxis-specific protein-glutamate methyltransferase CheB [Verrucomicrobiae bacterium]